MPQSLIEQLPKIVAEGKKEAEQILERLSSSNKITLQTNELVLPSKERSGLFRGTIPILPRQNKVPIGATQLDLRETPDTPLNTAQMEFAESASDQWFNRLMYGDNLLVMQALLAGDEKSGLPSMRGKIDLIYIDPPFDSKADYRTKITLPNGDIEQKPTVIEQFAYSDTWKDGTVSYLKMMYPRLVLMRELLSDKGSIYVHIDWHVGHYVKVLLDEVFGREKFLSDIVFKRTAGHHLARGLDVMTDSIYYYSKNSEPIYHQQFQDLSEAELNEKFPFIENETGRKFTHEKLEQSSNAYSKGEVRIIQGRKVISNIGWRWTQETIDLRSKENPYMFFWTENGKPRYKRYSDEYEGRKIGNLWDDIALISSNSSEALGYGTQKPKALLERIICQSSKQDAVIADFFAGSGTTGAVAEKLGRKWIMSDIGKPACMIMRKRLIDQEAKPFFYQAIGDYQKEQFTRSEYRTIGSLAQVVMQLYGALPFTQEGSPGNVGYMKQSRTLVVVDSPNKLTGLNTIKKAQQLRASYMGGWNKVVVLGWSFEMNIGQVISNLNDPNLEVLVIPADLLDKLKSKASYQQLIKSGKVRFSSLQYLTIKPIKVERRGSEDEITIELDNYVLLSPDALPLTEDDRAKLQNIVATDPLSLIEYWSIDPEYDGEVFRSRWQDYRGNVKDGDDELHVARSATLKVQRLREKHRICVKAVDVFGFDSVVIEEVR